MNKGFSHCHYVFALCPKLIIMDVVPNLYNPHKIPIPFQTMAICIPFCIKQHVIQIGLHL